MSSAFHSANDTIGIGSGTQTYEGALPLNSTTTVYTVPNDSYALLVPIKLNNGNSPKMWIRHGASTANDFQVGAFGSANPFVFGGGPYYLPAGSKIRMENGGLAGNYSFAIIEFSNSP